MAHADLLEGLPALGYSGGGRSNRFGGPDSLNMCFWIEIRWGCFRHIGTIVIRLDSAATSAFRRSQWSDRVLFDE